MSVTLEDAGLRRTASVRQIASARVATIYDKNTIEQAAQRILQSKIRRLPVIDKTGKLLGIITSLDVLVAISGGRAVHDHVSGIMVKNVFTCHTTDSLESGLNKMKTCKRGGLPIVNDKKVVGIVSERDFVRNFDHIDFKTPVERIMVRKPIVIKISHTAHDALKAMTTSRLRRLPVVENEKVIGLVTAYDLLHELAQNKFDVKTLARPVTSFMRKFVVKIEKNLDVSSAIKVMNSVDVGGVIVTDKSDKLQGILTDRDILNLIN